jgi:hypothetical protein
MITYFIAAKISQKAAKISQKQPKTIKKQPKIVFTSFITLSCYHNNVIMITLSS